MKISQEKALKEKIERLNRENKRLVEKLTSVRTDRAMLLKDFKYTSMILNEISPAVILIQGGQVVLSNQAALSMLRYAEEEFIGRDFMSLFHDKSAENAASILERWADDGPQPSQFELSMSASDGAPVFCEVSWKKIRYGGRSAYLLCIADIEKRKSEEKELLQAQKINSIGSMAFGLSRDMTLGLKNFREQFNLISADGTFKSKNLLRSLKNIESIIETGDSITQKLRCLAKQRYEPKELVVFDLNKVISEAVSASCSRQGGANGQGPVNVSTYPRAVSPVEGRPEEMRDALICLILNAMDAMPDGGDIYLSVEENLGFVWLYIQDSGTGIPDEVKDKIFDPFFTTRGANRPGLGLSISYAIISRHNGQIDVSSTEGHGSVFVVKLPPYRQPDLPVTKEVRNIVKDLRILIISKGGPFTDILTEILDQKGGRVAGVSTCAEASKRLLGKKNIDLVITDIETPDFESSAIISNIKKMKDPLPVILLSPRQNGKGRRISSKLDTDLLIERPLEFKVLSSIISRAMAMHPKRNAQSATHNL
ncbi:putative Histidine kinase [uncultured Desulfobacterium sp.]|uniref:histidine kinase n=1 Tax=uncultured Desulfobacterium sp. TaxID=201089 RepID=A0A445MS48_9BACT|nr:putative Histidine kinase [uncultured Desulfobacterium sp.]